MDRKRTSASPHASLCATRRLAARAVPPFDAPRPPPHVGGYFGVLKVLHKTLSRGFSGLRLPITSGNFTEWNAHLDFRARLANGFDFEIATHAGRPLAHPEQTEAAFSSLFGQEKIRIEANPVVLDRQLNAVARLRQTQGDFMGMGVLLHVGQGLLENAQRQ